MHILIVRNNSNSQASDASLLLATYLNSQGITYVILDSSELIYANEDQAWDVIGNMGQNSIDMVVVLGGDGTILRTARLVRDYNAPILGINFGHLGFLANSNDEGVVSIVAAALAGDVMYEHKTNLCIDVACEGDDLENFPHISFAGLEEGDAGETDRIGETKTFFALNELSITRGALGRIIDFDLLISGAHIAAMRGDGIVVATATGSTAYALSAGGPLVAPSYEGLIVVPLAPHTLHSRSIVTASNDIVEIDLTNNSATREATLFIDGEMLKLSAAPVRICVRRGSKPTTLIRYKREGFYEHLSQIFF